MTELKTLKDILGEKLLGLDQMSDITIRLRQEAIRWIKEFQKRQKKLSKSADNYNLCFEILDAKMTLMQYFFNITNKDLKCANQ